MSNLIVAVGGTGQLALQYYLQQYLLGAAGEEGKAAGLRVYVLDTDALDPGLAEATAFFERLQFGREPSDALGASVPYVEFVRCAPGLTQGTARELLIGAPIVGADSETGHPANAFFSSDALGMDLTKGLYARPALSSTVSHDRIDGALPTPKTGSNTVVVGSAIGGTGGGLLAPVVDALDQKSKVVGQPSSLHAVVFGEYFQPDDGILKDALARFQSNRTFVLRSLEDGRAPLTAFYVAGGPGTNLGQPLTSGGREHLPWPRGDEPMWKATRAIDLFLGMSKKETSVGRFADSEVDDDLLSDNYERAGQRLRTNLARARAFVSHGVVGRMLREPFPDRIWGSDLRAFVGAYWDASEIALGESRRDEFPGQLQSELKSSLDSVERMLPKQAGRGPRVTPEAIKKVRWPPVKDHPPNPTLFQGETAAAERAAAALLFWLLRS